MPWQRLIYDRAYRTGRSRHWDTGVTPPEVVAEIEGDRPLPPGRALDLGCGTGTNALYLAAHGWQVVGVDFVGSAIEAARRKAGPAEGVTFIQGDVTRLSSIGVEGPFDLVLDVGCFHSNSGAGRDRYAAQVARLTRPGAMLLLFGFGSRWRGLLGVPGLSRPEVLGRFGGAFDLERTVAGSEPVGAAWYYLRRR
jgi:SAM-dependent methyltransferase